MHKVVNAYAVNTLAILLINSIWHVATFSNGLFGRKTVFVSLPSDGEVFVKSLTGAFILGFAKIINLVACISKQLCLFNNHCHLLPNVTHHLK